MSVAPATSSESGYDPSVTEMRMACASCAGFIVISGCLAGDGGVVVQYRISLEFAAVALTLSTDVIGEEQYRGLL